MRCAYAHIHTSSYVQSQSHRSLYILLLNVLSPSLRFVTEYWHVYFTVCQMFSQIVLGLFIIFYFQIFRFNVRIFFLKFVFLRKYISMLLKWMTINQLKTKKCMKWSFCLKWTIQPCAYFVSLFKQIVEFNWQNVIAFTLKHLHYYKMSHLHFLLLLISCQPLEFSALYYRD